MTIIIKVQAANNKDTTYSTKRKLFSLVMGGEVTQRVSVQQALPGWGWGSLLRGEPPGTVWVTAWALWDRRRGEDVTELVVQAVQPVSVDRVVLIDRCHRGRVSEGRAGPHWGTSRGPDKRPTKTDSQYYIHVLYSEDNIYMYCILMVNIYYTSYSIHVQSLQTL